MSRSVVKWFWIDGKIGHWLAFWLVIISLAAIPFVKQSKMISDTPPSVEVWSSDVFSDSTSVTKE